MFGIAVSDADIHHLCGPTVYQRADQFERDGHVLNPTFQDNRLEGRVRGTIRRECTVRVFIQARQLGSSCSCSARGFCSHAGALALHWLRSSASFKQGSSELVAEPSGRDDLFQALIERGQPPARSSDALDWMLQRYTLPQLRDLARTYRLSTSNLKKSELIGSITAFLADDLNIERLLGALDDGLRLALVAAELVCSAHEFASPSAIAAAFRALGGIGEPPVDQLLDRGLLFWLRQAGPNTPFVVPHAVVSLLPPLSGIVKLAEPANPAAGGLTFDETFVAIAHELGAGPITARAITDIGSPAELLNEGWQIDPSGAEGSSLPAWQRMYLQKFYVLPVPSFLSEATLQQLMGRTGQSAARLEFTLDIMVVLGLLHGPEEITLARHRLQELLTRPAEVRRRAIFQVWQARLCRSEQRALVGVHGPLQLHLISGPYGLTELPSLILQDRRLLIDLISHLETDVWIDFRVFVQTFCNLAAAVLIQPEVPGITMAGRSETWSLVERTGQKRRLSPTSPEGQRVLSEALAVAALTGPLSWLQAVEVRFHDGQPVAFRACPIAHTGRVGKLDPVAASNAPSLRVEADLTVRVPAGQTDGRIHATLAQAAELIAVSAASLDYRITAESVQPLFESGTTGPELEARLESWANEPLPEEARTRIDGWWNSFGAVQLYDDLTLIETSDDFLLTELSKSTSLAPKTLDTVSSRVVIVDPSTTGRLLAELARLGQTPLLLEGD